MLLSYFYALLITHAIFLLLGVISKSSSKGRFIGGTVCSLLLLGAFPFLLEYLGLATAAGCVLGVALLAGFLLSGGVDAPATAKMPKAPKAQKMPKAPKATKMPKAPKPGKMPKTAAATVGGNFGAGGFDDIYAAQISNQSSINAASKIAFATDFAAPADAFQPVPFETTSPGQHPAPAPAFGEHAPMATPNANLSQGQASKNPNTAFAPTPDFAPNPAVLFNAAPAVAAPAQAPADISARAGVSTAMAPDPFAPPAASMLGEQAPATATMAQEQDQSFAPMTSMAASQLTPEQIKDLLRARIKSDPFDTPVPMQNSQLQEVTAPQDARPLETEAAPQPTIPLPTEEAAPPVSSPEEMDFILPAITEEVSPLFAEVDDDDILMIPMMEIPTIEAVAKEDLIDFSTVLSTPDGANNEDDLDQLSELLLNAEMPLPPVLHEPMPQPEDIAPAVPLVAPAATATAEYQEEEPLIAADDPDMDVSEVLRGLSESTSSWAEYQPAPMPKSNVPTKASSAPKGTKIDLDLPFGQPLCLQLIEELKSANKFDLTDKQMFDELYHIVLNKREDDLSDHFLNNVLSTFLSIRAVSAIHDDDRSTAKDMLLRICHGSKNPDILNKAFGMLVSLYTDEQNSILSKTILQSADTANVLIVPVINSVSDGFLNQLFSKHNGATATSENGNLNFEDLHAEEPAPKTLKARPQKRKFLTGNN